VREPVEKRGCHLRIAEDLRPFRKTIRKSISITICRNGHMCAIGKVWIELWAVWAEVKLSV